MALTLVLTGPFALGRGCLSASVVVSVAVASARTPPTKGAILVNGLSATDARRGGAQSDCVVVAVRQSLPWQVDRGNISPIASGEMRDPIATAIGTSDVCTALPPQGTGTALWGTQRQSGITES